MANPQAYPNNVPIGADGPQAAEAVPKRPKARIKKKGKGKSARAKAKATMQMLEELKMEMPETEEPADQPVWVTGQY